MGWLGGWFSSESSSSSNDPLRKLDPKLREFLEKESPVKFTVTPPPAPEHRQQRPTAHDDGKPGQAEQESGRSVDGDATAPAVPRESLFPDGRYAHLWRTYRPQAVVDAEMKSDHEKMMDVLDGYKERRSQIGRAALENCADEQVDWTSCMKNGDWNARLTMCSKEVRKFERCYMMQSRLLKTLGYLSVDNRSPEVDEKIQMHADTLFHRMLEQETEIEAAKAEGRPIPDFAPLVPKPVSFEDDDTLRLRPDEKKKWKDKLDKVKEADREAEEQAMKAEQRAKLEVAAKIQSLWEEQAKGRAARKEKGEETIRDKLDGILGRK